VVGSYVISGRGLVVGSYVLSGRGLVVDRCVPYWLLVGGRHLCAFLVGVAGR
jgi:hypothetical protein